VPDNKFVYGFKLRNVELSIFSRFEILIQVDKTDTSNYVEPQSFYLLKVQH
jgi:hypothetical protein